MAMKMQPFKFSDISEWPDERLLPPLDRENPHLMTHDQLLWNQDGVLVLKDFMPANLIDAYKRRWISENVVRPGGWPVCTPYMSRPEIRDLGLYPPLMEKLKELISDDMGMHLNLTGWVSTQRSWHQDHYLDPEFINVWYAAVWIALEDIHPDSGPFEFVRGSHKWALTRRELLFKYMPEEWKKNPAWPSLSQDAVSAAFEEEIAKQKAKPEKFIAKRGDVLIWHGRLAHRGTKPENPKLLRHAFIAHYSALSRRHDMPNRQQHDGGGWYFSLGEDTPV